MPAAEPDRSAERCALVLLGVGTAEVSAAFPVFAASRWTVVAGESLAAKGAKVVWDELAVVAGSLAELRLEAPWLVRAGRSAKVTFAVTESDRSADLQPPRRVRGAQVLSCVRVPAANDASGVAVSLGLDVPIPMREVARVLLGPGLSSPRTMPAAGLRLGLTARECLPWGAGDGRATLVGSGTAVARDVEGPLYDLLVGPGVHDEPDPRIARFDLSERFVLPPVDTAVVSPTGYRFEMEGVGRLTFEGESASFTIADAAGRVLVRGNQSAGLTESHIAGLRGLASVEADADGAPRLEFGRLVTQLCCAGVPTRATGMSAPLVDALGPELSQRLQSLDPADLDDPLSRESWSVATRRVALLRFAPDRYWRERGRGFGRPVIPEPTVSVLLATRRADFVAFALAQVQRQDWPALEVVLVLHGVSPSDPGVAQALATFSRPITVVEAGPDVLFGDALNLGLERCDGELVTKMDDDDWYGPHHITDLVLARGYSGAALVGLSGYFMYLHGSDVTVRRTGHATEAETKWVAGSTMLLGTGDFRSIGGWRATRNCVDWHLIRAVRFAGGSLYGIHDLGFLYYRGHDHTWAADTDDSGWLGAGPSQRAGLHGPPQLAPLRHPRVG